MEPILSLQHLSFEGQNISIIRDLSLDFEEGKTTALAGVSGCGKSTLLKLSAGLLIPSKGDVFYRGKNIASMNRQQTMEFRRESAFVFQDSALWANQSLYQNLELPLRLHYPELSQAERCKRIREVSAMVGYRRDLEMRPAALSMGEQKLIGFARAIICRPKLLFLDEWTESLDDKSAGRLAALVKQWQLEHNTIVFVSHNPGILKSLAQEIILLSEGRSYVRLTAEQIRQDVDLAALLEQDAGQTQG